MAGYQYDIMETQGEGPENEQLGGQPSLPHNPLQYKLAKEEPILSRRELEIMQMILTGLSLNEIALNLPLSLHGVKYRVGSIYEKFNVNNRLQLINLCSTTGLQVKTESGIKKSFYLEFKCREFQTKKDQD